MPEVVATFSDVHGNLPALEVVRADVDFVRVPYDVERGARAIESTSMPDEYARMLRMAAG